MKPLLPSFVVMTMMLSCLKSQADCSQLPQKSGLINRLIFLDDVELNLKAELEVRKLPALDNPEGVELSHVYKNPIFSINGERVNVTREAAVLIFRSLNYQDIEYAKLKQATTEDAARTLNSDLIIKATINKQIIIDSGSAIMPFHEECSNWQY